MRSYAPVLIACSVLACLTSCKDRSADEAQVFIGEHVFQVELAQDQAARARGLGGRTRPPAAGHGMLFVFEKPDELAFHMKDCLFPIDLAFFDADGRIVSLHTMPVANNPAYPQQTFRSDGPALYALEVAGGTWQQMGIKEGDMASFMNVPKR